MLRCFGASVATLPGTALGQTIDIHVNANHVGPEDGLSWATPYTDFQMALNSSFTGAVIAVATGTYKPSTGTTRSDTFVIGDEIKVYGGFSGDGTEFVVSDRAGLFSQTILSGDLGQGINSYHVVTINDVKVTVNALTVLDGFKIQGGSADHPTSLVDRLGGGILSMAAGAEVRNCTFRGNHAADGGGGMCVIDDTNPNSINTSSAVRLAESRFESNTTDGSGGGLMLQNLSGGAQVVHNCTFLLNEADSGSGGGIFIDDNRNSDVLEVLNCSIYDNSAMTGGGISLARDTYVTVENCTIAFNTTTGNGGGVAFSGDTSTNGTLQSCIITRNTSPGLFQVAPTGGSAPSNTVSYCNVQDSVPAGIGNISALAKFQSPANRDFHLKATSPCLDTGVPVFGGTGVPTDTFDLDGNTNFTEIVPVDLDSQTRVSISSTTSGAPLRIDMGAFERIPEVAGQ
ncbi:MAG: hypothetical protein ACI8QC_003062 [Planctomycetota bacterium]